MRLQQGEQVFQNVRPGNRKAHLFQECFQILFRALLAEETALIMQGIASAVELAGGPVVGLGLSHPLPRRLFHTGLSPSS